MALIIIGAVLILIGFICFWKRKQAQYQLTSIMIVRESSVIDLEEEYNEVSDGLGEGYLKQLIGLHGKIQSPEPLLGELSQQPCVKYRTLVTREWEEEYEEEDDEGRVVTRTRQGSDTVLHHKQEQPFYVNDGSGAIRVSPDGAKMDWELVTNRYEPMGQRGTLSLGGQVINLLQNLSSSRQVRGYRYQEWVVPLERRVFVYGEVTDSGGELTFQKPSDPEKPDEPYIVTFKSKSELIGSTTRKIKTLLYCGVGGLVIGAGMVVVGVLQG